MDVAGAEQKSKRIFIAGGTGFLGQKVTLALLERGANVTLLIHDDDSAGDLDERVNRVKGDPWHPASLRGKARGHDVVLHLIGSVRADPRRGLTFKQINGVSAHNIAQVAMGDGVQHILLLSAAGLLGASPAYLQSKRDAEIDLKQIGLAWTIVRAPAIFIPGRPRSPIYWLLSVLGHIPPLNILLGNYRPIPVHTAALGIASLALSAGPGKNRLVGPRELRRLGRTWERERGKRMRPISPREEFSLEPGPDEPDEPPFGWSPRDG